MKILLIQNIYTRFHCLVCLYTANDKFPNVLFLAVLLLYITIVRRDPALHGDLLVTNKGKDVALSTLRKCTFR